MRTKRLNFVVRLYFKLFLLSDLRLNQTPNPAGLGFHVRCRVSPFSLAWEGPVSDFHPGPLLEVHVLFQ